VPENRTLVRSDGSTVRVPEGDAEKLRTLGYRDQSPTQALESSISEGTAEYYSDPGEKIKTVGEGLLSGASLGLSDLVMADDDTRERARYNPGLRLGSELVGSLLPDALGVGELTPVGQLTRGAARAGEAIGKGSKVISTLARTGIEGVGFGAGAAISTAKLNGDPVTAEAVLAGAGWGAVWGGGLGALGGVVESRIESRLAKKAAEAETEAAGLGVKEANYAERATSQAKVNAALESGMRERHAALGALEEGHWDNFRANVVDSVQTIKSAVDTASGMSGLSGGLDTKKLKFAQQSIYSQLIENYDLGNVRKEAQAFTKSFALAQHAAETGQYEKMISNLEKFKDNMVVIEQKLGGAKFFNSAKAVGMADELIGGAKLRIDLATGAAEELTKMEAVKSTLSSLPKTAEEFSKLRPATIEKLSASVDQLTKLKSAELAGIQSSVADSVDRLTEGLGIKMEGTPGQKLAGTWKAIKEARSVRVADELRAAKDGKLLWNKANKASDRAEEARSADIHLKNPKSKALGPGGRAFERAMAYQVGVWGADKLGSRAGYLLGSNLVYGLIGMKGAILGTIAEKVEHWAPKAARAVEKYGSRIEPLKTRLDGQDDGKESDRKRLMASRMKEISEAAPSVRDTLFKGVEPLSIEHPELAAAIHSHAVQRFQFLLSKLPKDPGLAYSGLRSIWKPDDYQTEKFARYYEVFQNPIKVMNRALTTGKITLEAAEGLREMNPELWQHMRSSMFYKLGDPAIRNKLGYDDQVHLSLLLGVNLHSTLNPQFISAQQQMFTERNKPLSMNPQVQPGGGAGRPSGPGPSATSAQRITEH
jgi:hypothetical protein